MTTKNKQILIASISISLVVVLAIIACVLVLTLTDKDDVPHIIAEGIKPTLKRTALKGYGYDEKTGMVNIDDKTVVDFTKPSKDNIFGLNSSSIVVPSCKYQATMNVANDGEKAFDYWLEFNLNTAADAFAEQLKVTVVVDGGETKQFVLSKAKTVGSAAEPIATVNSGESSNFTVSIYFDDDDYINDDAQNKAIYFDVKLCAVQSGK